MTHYTIRARVAGGWYLVEIRDGRFWLYPPQSFTMRVNHGLADPYGYTITHPHEGREITAPWPWWSRRRARRIVAKAERRVARAMRHIYRANAFAQRQEKTH